MLLLIFLLFQNRFIAKPDTFVGRNTEVAFLSEAKLKVLYLDFCFCIVKDVLIKTIVWWKSRAILQNKGFSLFAAI